MTDQIPSGYLQDRFEFLQEIYGISPDAGTYEDSDVTQELGSVLCKEGRLLTFPNILQHRVSPFSLADESKNGHRKILALFLVDPHRRIISSANVPPQRGDWGREKRDLVNNLLARSLPPELQEMVLPGLFDSFMDLDEAKKHRLALMYERGLQSHEANKNFESGCFSLCEH